ncbi:MAG TPA: RHS repeat-associated core domain-containing protein, partial [Paenibacillus cookii]|nr:RHS repeat-associated core domain-containing protein [Paenibacillus cookii]
RARYYQPEIGRFISEDTYKGTLGNPLSQNLYAYVANNPLIYVDPSGHAGRLFDFRGGSGGARSLSGGVERGGGVASIRVTNRTSTLSSGPYKVSSPSKIVLKNSLNNFPIKATPNKSYFTPKYLKVGEVANKGTGKGLETKGYKPQPGERTFEGYVKKNVPADKETTLHTNSKGFNNNSRGSNPDGQFKRFGTDSHAGLSPHVHQPTRNVNKNGEIFGGQGSKTQGGGVTSPGKKDVSQLYDYLNNGKYRR